MRTMWDAVNPLNCPTDVPPPQLVAGYIDGNYQSYNGLAERFPSAKPVSIAVFASGVADVLDVESTFGSEGNAPASAAPGWALQMRARGIVPTVYSNTSVWPTILAEFAKQGVAKPLWWAARYNDIPTLEPGSIATQYHGGPTAGYDVSVVADYWPGVDPAPTPTPIEEDDMKAFIQLDSKGGTYLISPTLTTRVQLTNLDEVNGLLKTGQYIRTFLPKPMIDRIPVVK